tara:strand:- start:1693 stop:2283 length:591 start_codon:yes stop_codon:yes gene_type:complete
MDTAVRFVGIGEKSVGKVLEHARLIGAETSEYSLELVNFDHGSIDWRGSLGGVHWLLLSSSNVIHSQNSKSAHGAAMTFSELEGSRVVMIVDLPDEEERLIEAWGFVIERIRQINILYITSDAISHIASIEQMSEKELLEEIRIRGMVPQVLTIDPNGKVRIFHSLGDLNLPSNSRNNFSWLATYLCQLPNVSHLN